MQRRVWRWLFGIVVVVLLILVYRTVMHWLKAPRLNPKPNYFFTVTGKVAPSLHQHFRVKWTAKYYTTKSRCETDYNYLAGVGNPRQREQAYWVEPDKAGGYRLRIPLDKYARGYCGWAAESINVDLYDENKALVDIGPIFFAGKTQDVVARDAQLIMRCSVEKNYCQSLSEKPLNLEQKFKMPMDVYYKLNLERGNAKNVNHTRFGPPVRPCLSKQQPHRIPGTKLFGC